MNAQIGSRLFPGTLALVAIGALASASSAQSFNYPNFNSTAGLQLNGVAVQSNGLAGEQKTLSITEMTNRSAGSFYYGAQQQVNLGFTTQFRFRMRDRAGLGSDGIAFVIQNESVTALGGEGGAMGYATNLTIPTDPNGRPNTGITNSVAIVFDTWDNANDWSTVPGGNILTVQTRGVLANGPDSTASIGATPIPGAFNDGAIHTARVTYTPGLLSIFYDNLATPALTVPLNLSNTMNLTAGGAFLGFTAATGGFTNMQRHEIIDWSFSSVQIPAPGAAGLIAMGGVFAARRRRTVNA